MLQQPCKGLLDAVVSAVARGSCPRAAAWRVLSTVTGAAGGGTAAQALQQQLQQQLQHQQHPSHPQQQQDLVSRYLYQAGEQRQQQLPRFQPLPRKQQPLPVLEALALVKSAARARFPETIEAHVRLKVDPRRGDQMVRGAALLPHSLGKPLSIAVFAEGAAAEEARAAGADVVGSDELVARILDSKGKDLGFNACLATPDMMPQLVKLGRILGPRGLMPNPKVGTLTDDVAGAIAELRQGRLEFKMDRGGIVHAPIGRVPFELGALHANIGALVAALLAAKPEAIKGGLTKFLRSVHVASTMGRAVPVDVGSLGAAMDAAAAAMAAQHGGGGGAGGVVRAAAPAG